MRVLRYFALVGLGIWVGGMVTLGALVAPVAFATVAAERIDGGRALVGILFAAFLHRFHVVALGAAAIVFASLVGRKLIGPRPVRFGARVGLLATMLAATLYSGFVLTGRIERIQREVGVPSLTLPDEDPVRAEFTRLHRLSVALMGFNVLGGLVLLGWEAVERT